MPIPLRVQPPRRHDLSISRDLDSNGVPRLGERLCAVTRGAVHDGELGRREALGDPEVAVWVGNVVSHFLFGDGPDQVELNRTPEPLGVRLHLGNCSELGSEPNLDRPGIARGSKRVALVEICLRASSGLISAPGENSIAVINRSKVGSAYVCPRN
jgi:hypothetical protein